MLQRRQWKLFALAFILVSCKMGVSKVANDDRNPKDAYLALKFSNHKRTYIAYVSALTKFKDLTICLTKETSTTCVDSQEHPLTATASSSNSGTYKIYEAELNELNAIKTHVVIIQASGMPIRYIKLTAKGTEVAPDPSSQLPNYTGDGVTGVSDSRDFTASNSLTSNYLIHAPRSNSKNTAHGIMIYLHGDGASDHLGWWQRISKVVVQRNMIAVSVLAPNRSSWYMNGREYPKVLHELIQKEIYPRYNVDRTKVYFTGASGGPQFLTGQFLPKYGNSYRGGALPMCGGGGPLGYRQWMVGFSPTPDFIQGFQFYYYTGTADKLYSQVRDSAAFYQSLGFRVQAEYPSNVGHCEFQLDSVLNHIMGKAGL